MEVLIESLYSLQKNDSSSFLKNLEILEINGCQFSKNYHILNDLIMVLPKLTDLQLIGTSLAENIGEVAESLRVPE